MKGMWGQGRQGVSLEKDMSGTDLPTHFRSYSFLGGPSPLPKEGISKLDRWVPMQPILTLWAEDYSPECLTFDIYQRPSPTKVLDHFFRGFKNPHSHLTAAAAQATDVSFFSYANIGDRKWALPRTQVWKIK